ncbi:hypothetical protein ACJ41P_10445 [Azospirillum argentinense]|uniref:Uncharacterized protein n=1 Tax=Azospirillum argentinense TaxID=2970906 RepID=A0ABW8V4W1_9PROT
MPKKLSYRLKPAKPRKKNIPLKRLDMMLKTEIKKNVHPERLGAVECSVAGNLLYALMKNCMEHPTCTPDLREVAERTLPLLRRSVFEPLEQFDASVANELCGISADLCIMVKAKVIDANIGPAAFCHTVYYWLDELLTRGPERGGLAMADNSSFNAAWVQIAELIATNPEKIEATAKSCQKRARRFKEAFATYGFFMDPAIAQSVSTPYPIAAQVAA